MPLGKSRYDYCKMVPAFWNIIFVIYNHMDDLIETAVREVLAGKKYAAIGGAAVRRICAEMAGKHASLKELVKAVKKELHIIHGSFLTGDCHKQAAALIRGCCGGNGYGGDMHSDRETALTLMGLHVSTRERLADAQEIYGYIGGVIKPGDAIADIGCGYNPFALPFLPTRPAGYAAFDICERTVSLINLYFKPLGPGFAAYVFDAAAGTTLSDAAAGTTLSDVAAGTTLSDAVAGTTLSDAAAGAPAPIAADIVLMLKLFPLLERQRKGRTFELLAETAFRAAIVSFPTKSASGRERGMEAFYSDAFARGLPPSLSVADFAVFGNEMIYVITRNSP